MIAEHIAKIFERMSSTPGALTEGRERTRPSRDSGSVGGDRDVVIALGEESLGETPS